MTHDSKADEFDFQKKIEILLLSLLFYFFIEDITMASIIIYSSTVSEFTEYLLSTLGKKKNRETDMICLFLHFTQKISWNPGIFYFHEKVKNNEFCCFFKKIVQCGIFNMIRDAMMRLDKILKMALNFGEFFLDDFPTLILSKSIDLSNVVSK